MSHRPLLALAVGLLLIASAISACKLAPEDTHSTRTQSQAQTAPISDAMFEPPPPPTESIETVEFDLPYLCGLGTPADTCADCIEARLRAQPDGPDSACLCRGVDVRLPDALVIVDGTAKRATAELTVLATDGTVILCKYAEVSGRRLEVEACRRNGSPIPAGTIVHADAATLDVDAPGSNDLVVATQLSELRDSNIACQASAASEDGLVVAIPYGFPGTILEVDQPANAKSPRSIPDKIVVTHLGSSMESGVSEIVARLVDGNGRTLPGSRAETMRWSHVNERMRTVALPWPKTATRTTSMDVFLEIAATTTPGQAQPALWRFPLDTTPPTQDLEIAFGSGGNRTAVRDGEQLTTDVPIARIHARIEDDDALESFIVNVDDPMDDDPAGRTQVVKPIVIKSIDAGAPLYPIQVGPTQTLTIATLDRSGNLARAAITINVTGPARDDVNAYIDDLRRAMCDLDSRCGYGLFPLDTQTCLADFDRFGFLDFPPATDAALEIDWVRGFECIQQLDLAKCPTGLPLLRSDLFMSELCAGAFVGTIQPGEDCYVGNECIPGATCNGIEDGGCPGTCTTILRECGQTDCLYDEYCADEGMSTCAPIGDEGDDCSRLRADHECRDGLYCLRTATGFECTRGQEFGRACDTFDLPCEEGLSCQQASTGLSFCIAPEGGQPFAARCERSLLQCGHGLYCHTPQGDSTEVGVCLLRLPQGAACTANGAPCQRGLTCLRSSPGAFGTCEFPQPDGSSCLFGNDCASGRCFDDVCLAENDLADVCVRK